MRKKELIKKVDSLEKIIKIQTLENETLKKQIKDKDKKSLDKIMKNYAYAILVDRNIYPGVILYNDGRKEQHVKALNFTIDISRSLVPELTIEK